MGGAPDEVQIVAFMRAETGAAFVSARTLVSVASGRAERARLRDQVSRTNGTRSSGRSASVPRAHVDLIRSDSGTDHRRSDDDTGHRQAMA
jgi:hypothetical protein